MVIDIVWMFHNGTFPCFLWTIIFSLFRKITRNTGAIKGVRSNSTLHLWNSVFGILAYERFFGKGYPKLCCWECLFGLRDGKEFFLLRIMFEQLVCLEYMLWLALAIASACFPLWTVWRVFILSERLWNEYELLFDALSPDLYCAIGEGLNNNPFYSQ